MTLKDAHNKALNAVPNNYQVVDRKSTTGLETLGSDINAYNDYGMTPVHVAMQAGALDELKKILAHPDVDVHKPARSGKATLFFAAVYQQTNGGSSPFGGATAKTEEGRAVDARTREMKDLIKKPIYGPLPQATPVS